MKFGELIVQASDASTCLCAARDWFDYNGLKKLLDMIPQHEKEGGSECERAAAAKLGSCPEEKEFFLAIRTEMAKAVAVFNRLIRRETVMVSALLQSREVRSPQGLEQCIRLHRNLCFLRNFAVMNYCGVKKILKKHDKVTGFKTQEKYMRKVVSRSVLAVHPSLTLAINQLEAVYLEYKSAGTPGVAPSLSMGKAADAQAQTQAANPAADNTTTKSDSINTTKSNKSIVRSISAAAAGAEILAEFASAPVIRRGAGGAILSKRPATISIAVKANNNNNEGGAASSSSCQSDSNDEEEERSSQERKRVKIGK